MNTDASKIKYFKYDDGYYRGRMHGNMRHGFGTMLFNPNSELIETDEIKTDNIGFNEIETYNTCDNNIDYWKYEGTWANDKFDGTGALYFVDNCVYEGEFRDHVITGTGKLTFADKTSYTGEFRDNEMHGRGYLTTKDGSQLPVIYDHGVREIFAFTLSRSQPVKKYLTDRQPLEDFEDLTNALDV